MKKLLLFLLFGWVAGLFSLMKHARHHGAGRHCCGERHHGWSARHHHRESWV